jgi:hypothetical protein
MRFPESLVLYMLTRARCSSCPQLQVSQLEQRLHMLPAFPVRSLADFLS